MLRVRAVIIILLLFSAAPAAATRSRPLDPTVEWWRLALRLTGESDEVRVGALRALRKLPSLDSTLKAELLGPRRFLALDVITALRLRGLQADVLAVAAHDETGMAYSTVNTLMTDADRARVVEIYRREVASPTVPAAGRMVMLDTLARMNRLLRPAELEPILRDPADEVRASGLRHVRRALIGLGLSEYLGLATLNFGVNSRQLRLQALYLLREYAQGGRRRLPAEVAALLASCARPPFSTETVELCQPGGRAR